MKVLTGEISPKAASLRKAPGRDGSEPVCGGWPALTIPLRSCSVASAARSARQRRAVAAGTALRLARAFATGGREARGAAKPPVMRWWEFRERRVKSVNGQIRLSASDLMRFTGCRHAITLDLARLRGEGPEPRAPDAETRLLRKKGDAHEAAHLAKLRKARRGVVEIDRSGGLVSAVAATREALKGGADVVFQGAFLSSRRRRSGGSGGSGAALYGWEGWADFLERVEGRSKLGGFRYEVVDTKLSRRAKPDHVVQIAVHSDMLAEVQGVQPERAHLRLGDGAIETIRLEGCTHYARVARARLEAFVAKPEPTRPVPCAACTFCRWADHCSDVWKAEDSLYLVAKIRGSQIKKLEAAGVRTMKALSVRRKRVKGMEPRTLRTLSAQAKLQHARKTGKPKHRLLPAEPGKGFDLLPKPNRGDLFYDMEGDPHVDGGLEYLHGLWFDGKFKAFWAHDCKAEAQALAELMEFLRRRFRRHPKAHIHHYAHYEVTALRRLTAKHGIGERFLDQLLRERRFVDLHSVVRGGLITSEPDCSIKSLEAFYGVEREGGVTTAGGSIVAYETWRETGERAILDEIETYNRIDCVSTERLRDWLASIRPNAPWPISVRRQEREDEEGQYEEGRDRSRAYLSAALGKEADDLAWLDLEFDRREPTAALEPRRRKQGAAASRPTRRKKADGVGAADGIREFERTRRTHFRDAGLSQGRPETLLNLARFHRREAKVQKWKVDESLEKEKDELIEDIEALAGLSAIGDLVQVKKNAFRRAYKFPPQDTKLRTGSLATIPVTDLPPGLVSIVEMRPSEGKLVLENFNWVNGTTAFSLVQKLDLHPPLSLDTFYIQNAIGRVIRDQRRKLQKRRFRAADDLLATSAPRLKGSRAKLLAKGASAQGCVAVVKAMNGTVLPIQGPPGSGKTYLTARAILALVKAGHRVGVSSNSHEAIRNVLLEVEEAREGMKFSIIHKMPDSHEGYPDGSGIRRTDRNRDRGLDTSHVVGGTAYLFSRRREAEFDWLFVDEAGQVSLANMVAMATAARNVVLVGDPCQLPQVVQGTHPHPADLSCLEWILGEHATVPPDRGIFLPKSYRMHPKVCRFISEQVYEGRLKNHPSTARQKIAGTPWPEAGAFWVPCAHVGNAQSAEEEVRAIRRAITDLLRGAWIDRNGKLRRMRKSDIIVVAPYNAQVNALTRGLQKDIRVGTVDRFQGKEAAACLVSMTASSIEEVPQGMDFLFSLNRINVAVSRAKALALVFGSERLREARCDTVEQIRLVNTLCALPTCTR